MGLHITYKQLDERSNQLARHLINLGVGTEDCVALLLDRSADFVVAALAVLKAGLVRLILRRRRIGLFLFLVTPGRRCWFLIAVNRRSCPRAFAHRWICWSGSGWD